MSSVWAGWLRRLRKGQAEQPPVPAPHADVPAPADAVSEAAFRQETVPPDVQDVRPEGPPEAPETLPEAAIRKPSGKSPQELLCEGALAQARSALLETSPPDPGLAALVQALSEGEAVLGGLGLAHAGEPADQLRGIMLAPARRTRKLLLVFGQDGGAFAVPAALLHPGRPHLLFVQDTMHALALLGVPRLGGDYDACLLAVLRIARQLGAAELYCIGAGAASYSALRYGHDLGAAGVLALGTLTCVDTATQTRGLHPGRRFVRLLRVTAGLGADLHQVYRTAATRPGLIVCHPAGVATSELAPLAASVLEAPADAGEDLLAWAEGGDQLRGLLRDLLRCKAEGRRAST